MMSAINLSALEEVLEVYRLDEDWNACRRNLEQYSKIFEISEGYATLFHSDIRAMKSYYWICLAEVVFHSSGDFDNAIDYLRRGIAIYPNHHDIRGVTVRILLKACRNLLSQEFHLTVASGGKKIEKIKFDESIERPVLKTVLGERFQVVTAYHYHPAVALSSILFYILILRNYLRQRNWSSNALPLHVAQPP
jgi:hypothetical protein